MNTPLRYLKFQPPELPMNINPFISGNLVTPPLSKVYMGIQLILKKPLKGKSTWERRTVESVYLLLSQTKSFLVGGQDS